MIDAGAYRRFAAMGRMLVDMGHMTPQGLRMLDSVLVAETERPSNVDEWPTSRCQQETSHRAHAHIVGRQRYWCEGWA